MKIYRDPQEEYFICVVCELSDLDVENAIKEYLLYRDKKGNIYANDPFKTPTIEQFVRLYFGVLDDGDIFTPNIYVCTNKNTAAKLFNLLRSLAFHNKITEECCDVKLDGNIIHVDYGDD